MSFSRKIEQISICQFKRWTSEKLATTKERLTGNRAEGCPVQSFSENILLHITANPKTIAFGFDCPIKQLNDIPIYNNPFHSCNQA